MDNASPDRRILLAVVANDIADREAISSAFAGDGKHRVVHSCPLDGAVEMIDGTPIDGIVGFVDTESAWRQFRALADRFPEQLSVLLATDPDEMGMVADGVVLNTVVTTGRATLAQDAPRVASEAVREFGVHRTRLSRFNPVEKQRLESLTDREREVLALTAEGQSLKEIASTINRAYATVASHRNRIMEKLGLHDKVALARFAIRTGLIEP